MISYPVRQVAYYTRDIIGAARRHNKLFGSGPFYLSEHVPVQNFVYCGRPGRHDHSTIFGQWGELMVEFFTQHDSEPSHALDMFVNCGEQCLLHHVAIIPADPAAAIRDFEGHGQSVVSQFCVAAALDVTMIDTRPALGHMTEIYGGKAIENFYRMTKDAAREWDGEDLIRPVSLG